MSEQAEINAVNLHDALDRLLTEYKQLSRDAETDHAVESAERALYDYAPLADWERHKKKRPPETEGP